MSSSVIPATTPVSWTAVPDGSAASPSFAFQNSSGTGFYRVSANVLGISTAGVQRVVVDASGNVGIGTGSPLGRFNAVSGANFFSAAADAYTSAVVGPRSANDSTCSFLLSYGTLANYSSNMWKIDASSANLSIWQNAAQRMTIDSSGNLLVGISTTTSGARLAVRGSGTTGATYNVYTTNNNSNVIFATEDGGTIYTGTLSGSPYNNTTGSAANMFVTSGGVLQRSTSSLKYKKNVQDAWYGLNELHKLRAVTYESKSDSDAGKVFGGLIAEEVDSAGLKEFVQYAEDGTPDALAYGNIVSLCIKAIQELSAKVDAQAAEIEALKAK